MLNDSHRTLDHEAQPIYVPPIRPEARIDLLGVMTP